MIISTSDMDASYDQKAFSFIMFYVQRSLGYNLDIKCCVPDDRLGYPNQVWDVLINVLCFLISVQLSTTRNARICQNIRYTGIVFTLIRSLSYWKNPLVKKARKGLSVE